MEFLSVNGKVGIPRLRWDDLAYAIVLGFGKDVADVFERIFPFVFGGDVCRRLWNVEGPILSLRWFSTSSGLTSSLDRCKIQRGTA